MGYLGLPTASIVVLGWPMGLEPITFGATIRCSAIELRPPCARSEQGSGPVGQRSVPEPQTTQRGPDRGRCRSGRVARLGPTPADRRCPAEEPNDVSDPVPDPRPSHGEGPHDRRLPHPRPRRRANVAPDPRHRARARGGVPDLPDRQGLGADPRQPGAVHAPELRRPRRGRGARLPARRLGRVPVRGPGPRRPAVLRRGQGRDLGDPRDDRRLHHRLHPRRGARRAARGAGLGPQDRRGARRDGPRDAGDLRDRRAVARGRDRADSLAWAIENGLVPFLLLDTVKLVAAAAVFPAAWWVVGRRPSDR